MVMNITVNNSNIATALQSIIPFALESTAVQESVVECKSNQIGSTLMTLAGFTDPVALALGCVGPLREALEPTENGGIDTARKPKNKITCKAAFLSIA